MNKTLTILLLTGIAILVNILGSRLYFRADLTADGQFTLSQATRDILHNLNEPVTIKAYFTEGLPPEISRIRTDFRDMLVEYTSIARGNIYFEFIDPSTEVLQNEAMQQGVMPQQIRIRKDNQFVAQDIFLGAVLEWRDRTEVIPVIQPGIAMEYALSTTVKKLANINKPHVGLIQGHNGPGLDYMAQVRENLNVLYNVSSVYLGMEGDELSKYTTLMIVAPQDSFSPRDIALLDNYIASGGNLVIALNRVGADFQQMMASPVSTGLEDWLETKGLSLRPELIIDDQCGSVPVQQQRGIFMVTNQIKCPFLPVITNFADHPVTQGVQQVLLQFPTPLNFTGSNPGIQFTPLAFTSGRSDVKTTPHMFNVQEWNTFSYTQSGLVVAGVLESSSPEKGSIVVIADGDFAVNGPPGQQQQLSPDNINLFVNSVDFLSDDTGLIELRSKQVRSRPIAEMESAQKNMLKYANFLTPIGLVVLYGIFRSQMRRRTRIKRMQQEF